MFHKNRGNDKNKSLPFLVSRVVKGILKKFSQKLVPTATSVLLTLLKELPDSPAEDILKALSFGLGQMKLVVEVRQLLLGSRIAARQLSLLIACAAIELFLMWLAIYKSDLRK